MRYLLSAMLALGLCLPAAAQGAKTKEEKKEEGDVKEIAGKDIDQWIKELDSRDPSRRETAMITVLRFGPFRGYKAVPVLLAELKKHIPEKNSHIDLSVRVSGTQTLVALLSGVKEPDPKYVKEAVTILKRFLKDSQAVVRICALKELPKLGPEARVAVPEVLALVKDFDTWGVRHAAIRSLTALTADPDKLPEPKIIQALCQRLHDDASHDVRMAALEALALLGTPGELSQKQYLIRELEIAAKDRDAQVQIYSHLALMTVKQSITGDQVVAISKLLSHSDVTVKKVSAQALALAASMLEHKDKAVKEQVAQALGLTGKSKGVIPALLGGLDDPNPAVVVACLQTLALMKHVEAAQSSIANMLKHKDPAVRVQAAQTLGQAGIKAKAMGPLLLKGLDDPDADVKAACAIALVNMEYVNTIADMLKSEDTGVRLRAANALALAGPKASSAATALTTALADPDPNLKVACMTALVRLEWSEPVARLLKDPDVRLRAQAANALGLASLRDRTAGTALTGGLEDRDPGVVVACIIALDRLDYTPAVAALTKVADDPKQNEAVKVAAKEAATRLQNNEKARMEKK